MPEFLTTREIAELLRIKERKVYDLAASGTIPSHQSDGQIALSARGDQSVAGPGVFGAGFPRRTTSRPTVFLGSHDPLLEWALRQSGCGIATWFDGSDDGLSRFEQREGIATGLHLYDAGTDRWNVPAVASRFASTGSVLLSWAVRERGLIVSEQKSKSIQKLSDLKACRFTPRQHGAGAQNLFLHLAQQESLDIDSMNLAEPALTEVDAAMAVLEGDAEAAFGLATLATQYKLPFVPLVRERFDSAHRSARLV